MIEAALREIDGIDDGAIEWDGSEDAIIMYSTRCWVMKR
jgi:hypothetical protein